MADAESAGSSSRPRPEAETTNVSPRNSSAWDPSWGGLIGGVAFVLPLLTLLAPWLSFGVPGPSSGDSFGWDFGNYVDGATGLELLIGKDLDVYGTRVGVPPNPWVWGVAIVAVAGFVSALWPARLSGRGYLVRLVLAALGFVFLLVAAESLDAGWGFAWSDGRPEHYPYPTTTPLVWDTRWFAGAFVLVGVVNLVAYMAGTAQEDRRRREVDKGAGLPRAPVGRQEHANDGP